MKRIISLACMMALVISGCVTMQQEYGNPIQLDNIGKIVKGKSTRSDVIELFGMPTVNLGSGMPNVDATGVPSAIIASGDDTIFIYKQCTFTAVGRGGPFGIGSTGEGKERCEQLTIMLNKNDIVKAYSYHPDDPINDQNISKLVKGKSTKPDVIELFGAPTMLNTSGSDEIYIYKRTISLSKSGFMGMKSQVAQKVKQLTIIFDKNTEIAKTYSYQPYPQ